MAGVLDTKGVFLALLFGMTIVYTGGLSYLILMIVFFVLAIAATRYEHEIKRDMGLYEHERGWENVFANGILPTILAVLTSTIGPLPFICSLAAITADKFASEIGVLDQKQPISIFSFRKVKPGTSGAVSVIGTVASLCGAMLIGFASIFLFKMTPTQALLIGAAGFIGSFVDTLFGVYEENGVGTKETTNFFCSLAGALAGHLISWI